MKRESGSLRWSKVKTPLAVTDHLRRRVSVVAIGALVAVLAACAPALPDSVVAGTEITVGWGKTYTSANALAEPTSANIDIAAMTRGSFGAVVDGEFVADTGFGSVDIVDQDPFTVRYDLTEPVWSDGIPLDAADLLLGWAGQAGWLTQGDDVTVDVSSTRVPVIDEFARALEVSLDAPIDTWQQLVTVPVPAHLVGEAAFDLTDPMEAKAAVIQAITDADREDLAAMADAWVSEFSVAEGGDLTAAQTVSSGPYRVESISDEADTQRVVLVPNAAYRGATPHVARVVLEPSSDDPLAAVGDTQDIVQLSPRRSNRTQVAELERRDFGMTTAEDGTLWALLLSPTGVFRDADARLAFLHAAPASALVDGGAGEWATAFTGTTSVLTSPSSAGYSVVSEDSGFAEKIGAPGDEVDVQREAAGVSSASRVCVLYDTGSDFASGAFAALKTVTAEAGWSVVDCGQDDYSAALEARGWNAVIARIPVPESAAQIAAAWGTDGQASITGNTSGERDELIAQLGATTDIYEAREVRADIERTIVDAAVALPLAVHPRVVVNDRQVTGVALRNGGRAPLLSGASGWEVAP